MFDLRACALAIIAFTSVFIGRNVTAEEWEQFTRQNIERAAKEITSARPLRAYVDTILKQVIEDLWNQYNVVNDAFRRRIEETKEAKTKLEMQHSEVRFCNV